MTRIVHLIPGLTGGGAERQLTLLAPALAKRGHEVHIGITRAGVPETLVAHPGVTVHHFPLRSNHDPRLVHRIRSLIRTSRAELLQTWLTQMDVAGATAAALTRTPWILSERSEAAAYPSSFKNNARARLGRYARAIIANSAGGVAYWRAQGVPAPVVHEVPNAIDLLAIRNSATPSLPAACEGRPLVLFVGRLAEEKMPFVMIDALSEALPATNAVAMLCGVGPLEGAMREAIAARAMTERIILAGHRSDVFGLMRTARACVAISRFEGSPNVALEAMAAGCPLVVSDIPAYRQLVDETCAHLVPVGDAGATARAITEVLANAGAATERSARAQARVASLTPANVAASLDDIYHQVLTRTQ